MVGSVLLATAMRSTPLKNVWLLKPPVLTAIAVLFRGELVPKEPVTPRLGLITIFVMSNLFIWARVQLQIQLLPHPHRGKGWATIKVMQ